MEQALLSKTKTVSNFIKQNPEVIFTWPDKGNSTVAIDKTDYISTINNMLKDNDTYYVITKDLTLSIENEILQSRAWSFHLYNYVKINCFFDRLLYF